MHPFAGAVPGTIEGSLKVVRDQLAMPPEDLEWLLRKTAESVYFFDLTGVPVNSERGASAPAIPKL